MNNVEDSRWVFTLTASVDNPERLAMLLIEVANNIRHCDMAGNIGGGFGHCNYELTSPTSVAELAKDLEEAGEPCPHCQINSVYDGCCFQCGRPPSFYDNTEKPA